MEAGCSTFDDALHYVNLDDIKKPFNNDSEKCVCNFDNSNMQRNKLINEVSKDSLQCFFYQFNIPLKHFWPKNIEKSHKIRLTFITFTQKRSRLNGWMMCRKIACSVFYMPNLNQKKNGLNTFGEIKLLKTRTWKYPKEIDVIALCVVCILA